jgi:hypothetical protein
MQSINPKNNTHQYQDHSGLRLCGKHQELFLAELMHLGVFQAHGT